MCIIKNTYLSPHTQLTSTQKKMSQSPYTFYNNQVIDIGADVDLEDVDFTENTDGLSYHLIVDTRDLNNITSGCTFSSHEIVENASSGGDGVLVRWEAANEADLSSDDLETTDGLITKAVAFYMLKDPSATPNPCLNAAGDGALNIQNLDLNEIDNARASTFLKDGYSWDGSGNGGLSAAKFEELVEAMGTDGHLKVSHGSDNRPDGTPLTFVPANIKTGVVVNWYITYRLSINIMDAKGASNLDQEGEGAHRSIFPDKEFTFAVDNTDRDEVAGKISIRVPYQMEGLMTE